MTEEVAVGLGGEPDGGTRIKGDGHAEAPRSPREGHPFTGVRLHGDVVAAAGKLDRADVAAVQAEQSGGIGAAVILARGSKALGCKGGLNSTRQRQHGGAAREVDQKRAAVELHRLSLHPWH